MTQLRTNLHEHPLFSPGDDQSISPKPDQHSGELPFNGTNEGSVKILTVAAETSTLEKTSAEKAAVEKAAAERALADKAAVEKAAAERALADKGASDKAAAERALADKAAAERALADKAAEKALADKAAEKAAAERALADKAAADKAASERAIAEKAAADRAAAERALAEKAAADKAAAEKAAAERALADKAAAEKAAAERALADKAATERAAADKAASEKALAQKTGIDKNRRETTNDLVNQEDSVALRVKLTELEQLVRAQSADKTTTKRAIKSWVEKFASENGGRMPVNRDKEAVKDLFEAHERAKKQKELYETELEATNAQLIQLQLKSEKALPANNPINSGSTAQRAVKDWIAGVDATADIPTDGSDMVDGESISRPRTLSREFSRRNAEDSGKRDSRYNSRRNAELDENNEKVAKFAEVIAATNNRSRGESEDSQGDHRDSVRNTVRRNAADNGVTENRLNSRRMAEGESSTIKPLPDNVLANLTLQLGGETKSGSAEAPTDAPNERASSSRRRKHRESEAKAGAEVGEGGVIPAEGEERASSSRRRKHRESEAKTGMEGEHTKVIDANVAVAIATSTAPIPASVQPMAATPTPVNPSSSFGASLRPSRRTMLKSSQPAGVDNASTATPAETSNIQHKQAIASESLPAIESTSSTATVTVPHILVAPVPVIHENKLEQVSQSPAVISEKSPAVLSPRKSRREKSSGVSEATSGECSSNHNF